VAEAPHLCTECPKVSAHVRTPRARLPRPPIAETLPPGTPAIFALWAYAWLAIVYNVTSPGVITIAEAVLTLAYFPMLVLAAWLTDKATAALRARAAARAAAAAGADPEARGAPSLREASLVSFFGLGRGPIRPGASGASALTAGGAGPWLLPAAAPPPAVAARRYASAMASRLALLEARAGHGDAVQLAQESLRQA
jgi:hypothetical protein